MCKSHRIKMKNKVEVIVTPTTIVLAGLTIVAIIVLNIFTVKRLISLLDLLRSGPITEIQLDKFELFSSFVELPLFLVMSILPIFWAWQNYKVYRKKWLYIIAAVLILVGLQALVAVGVLVFYLFNLWKDFEKWREEKAENQRSEQ